MRTYYIIITVGILIATIYSLLPTTESIAIVEASEPFWCCIS